MLKFLHKTSLRTRLILLTAVSILALLISVLSAYRTAQTSETFARRQAELNVSNAVRELLRETQDFPAGRLEPLNLEDKKPPLLPHEQDIFNRYADPLARSSAIALQRFPETGGGFCTTNGDVQGLTVADNFGSILTLPERGTIDNVCRQIQAARDFTTQQIVVEGKVLLVSAAPSPDKISSGAISGAVAFRRWQPSNLFGDWFSLITQGLLLIFVIGLTIFSFLTLRDWRRGMVKIETGLQKIPNDLSSRIDSPQIPEMEKISREVNRLAENLETNLARQKELEKDLTQNEKLAALGRMASGAAHEIRNPLAAMKLKIQLAERNKFETEKLAKTFTVLREEIERLDGIVKKLLEASRPARLDLSLVDVADLLRQRLAMTTEKAEAQKVKIESHIADSIIKGDDEKLTQVFDNLFNNSLEAMPEGGILRVKTSLENRNYVIEVIDSGKGISEEDKARLFELFYTTKDKGTGLGLAISREIIEAHGGRLYFSERETGAAFVIELPLLKKQKNEIAV